MSDSIFVTKSEAGYYSIIVDESRNLAKQELMSFVVRYFDINDQQVHEHFLAFLHAKCLNASHLSEFIRELITGFDFSLVSPRPLPRRERKGLGTLLRITLHIGM